MKDYRFPDNRFVKLCFVLLLFALQAVARATMYSRVFLGFATAQAMMIGLVLFIGLVFLVYNRRQLKQILTDRRMILLAGCALVILVPMLIKRDWQMMYFSILLCVLFPVFLTYFTNTRELGRYYVLIMTFLGAAALIGAFVLKPLALAGMIPANHFKSTGGWDMLNFGVTFVSNINEHRQSTMRAFGIFREPGLFQIFLFIAIHLNNDVVQWKKKWTMWAIDAVLMVTLLTTFATGGVLAMGLYMIFLFFDKGLYRSRRMRILVLVSILVLAAVVLDTLIKETPWAFELYGMVYKIIGRTDSMTARTESIASGIRIFLSSPVWGADLADVMYAVDNNTCTSPILFAVFGVVGGCVHVASWVALAWKKERSVLMNLILLVILFVPFNTQNVVHDMFFWLFPMMALTEKLLALPIWKKWEKKVN